MCILDGVNDDGDGDELGLFGDDPELGEGEWLPECASTLTCIKHNDINNINIWIKFIFISIIKYTN